LDTHFRPDEEELRRITDLIAQTIIVLDSNGQPIYANRCVLDYCGISLEEVLAKGFRERVFPSGRYRQAC
jgi:PAS domain S-box-containing protein